MKRSIALVSAALFLTGCVHQPPPPPQRDPMQGFANAITAFGAIAQAGKQAKAIASDTAVMFPSRSQAIALGLLSFKISNSRWPISKQELREYLVSVCRDHNTVAPAESDFDDLNLVFVGSDDIKFSFHRDGLSDESYSMNGAGVISFSISPQTEMLRQLSTAGSIQSERSASVSSVAPYKYGWGDLAMLLFVEVPLKVLAAPK